MILPALSPLQACRTLQTENADIIAIQETNFPLKARQKHLEILEELFQAMKILGGVSEPAARAELMFLYKKKLTPIVTFPNHPVNHGCWGPHHYRWVTTSSSLRSIRPMLAMVSNSGRASGLGCQIRWIAATRWTKTSPRNWRHNVAHKEIDSC